ncbi:MAG: AAA family ATPase [Thermoplasmata archaeon]|nr:AAA family ATPase [Thermoplasmata archaeon]
MSGELRRSGGTLDRHADADALPEATSQIRRPDEVLAHLTSVVGDVVVGSEWSVRLLYIALVTEGHVLLQGAPGIAKTLLVRRFAGSLDLAFKRIQFTPDMLPSDIIGNVVLNPSSRAFEYRRGPVFANVVLADEINRAPPKVQSALLEAMQERQVTVDGIAHPLPRPFIVIATQNPIEQEGTYPLPEAELDRMLFRLLLDYPSEEDEQSVIRRHHTPVEIAQDGPVADAPTIDAHRALMDRLYVDDEIVAYITRLIRATRDDKRISVGASPRAGVQLARAAKAEAMCEGRMYVTPEDVKRVAFWVLNHRVTLQPDVLTEGYAEGLPDERLIGRILTDLLDQVPVPR